MKGKTAITVNPEVFKLEDPRVKQLASGRISAEAFSLLIGPEDPFMLVDNTIFAMTENEYYATRAITPVNRTSEAAFRYVVELPDKSFMHKVDQDYMDRLKADLPTCPACRYRKYKNEVVKLIHKYNIRIPDEYRDQKVEADIPPYPKTSGQVVSLLTLMLQHMYRVSMPVRNGCIDCVEKHIAQAYILGNEVLCGYPEHFALVIGHLGEAIDELPMDFKALKDTLVFCLGYTRKNKRPFVPIGLIMPLVDTARKALNQSMEAQKDSIVDNRSTEMNLDFTDIEKNELVILDERILTTILRHLENADATSDRVPWEGAVACAADACAGLCPNFSNMLRNRRLIFIGDVALAAKSGYSFKEIRDYIAGCLTRMNSH